jgi:hypothetical protein
VDKPKRGVDRVVIWLLAYVGEAVRHHAFRYMRSEGGNNLPATSVRPMTRQRPGNEMKASRPQSVNQGYPAITVCCVPRSERYTSVAHNSSPAKESAARVTCRALSRRDFSRFARATTSSRSMVSLVRAKVLVAPDSRSNVNYPGDHQSSSASSPRCCSTGNCTCRYQLGSWRYPPEWKARTGGRSA